MENEKIKNGIKDINKLLMSKEEKEDILKNILSSSHLKPIPSPYTIYSIVSILYKNKWAYYGSLSCLVVVLGGGIVFASSNTLPGDILYPLKVNIVEPIHSAFIFSPESKAEYISSLATERLTEAETLEGQGKLDSKKEEQLNNLLSEHTTDLNKALDRVHKNKSEDSNDDIENKFQAQLKTHSRVVDILSEQDTKEKSKNSESDKNNQNEDNKDKTQQEEKVLNDIHKKTGLEIKGNK